MGRLREEGDDPDYRFSLANERTFLAWIRTALALLAGGVAVVQLAPALGAPGVRWVIGVGLIVLGTLLAAFSHRRWLRVERAMRLRRSLPPATQIPLLAYGVGLLAVGVLLVVVLR